MQTDTPKPQESCAGTTMRLPYNMIYTVLLQYGFSAYKGCDRYLLDNLAGLLLQHELIRRQREENLNPQPSPCPRYLCFKLFLPLS